MCLCSYETTLFLYFVLIGTNTSALSILQNEYTALMAAAQEGHANTAALLIEGGARVDLQSNVNMHGMMTSWVWDCGFVIRQWV